MHGGVYYTKFDLHLYFSISVEQRFWRLKASIFARIATGNTYGIKLFRTPASPIVISLPKYLATRHLVTKFSVLKSEQLPAINLNVVVSPVTVAIWP